MRLAHGYTNDSVRDGTTVTKHYREPGAAERLLHEAVLQAIAGHLPVPKLHTTDVAQRTLQTVYLPSQHGQELIDAGHAARVLLLCGRLLRQLQSLSPQLLPAGVRAGPVLVHGDFGPQNLLVAPLKAANESHTLPCSHRKALRPRRPAGMFSTRSSPHRQSRWKP